MGCKSNAGNPNSRILPVASAFGGKTNFKSVPERRSILVPALGLTQSMEENALLLDVTAVPLSNMSLHSITAV